MNLFPFMPGVWLWPRRAWAVAMVSWCNLLTSMGVIGTKICLAILRKSDLFGARWVHPGDPNIPFGESLTKLNIVTQRNRAWKGHALNYLVVGSLRHVFINFTFQTHCWNEIFTSQNIEKMLKWRDKKISGCEADVDLMLSSFRSQQECFERDIEIPRFIIIHGFRVPRKKRHSLCGEAWARLELLQKKVLCLEQCSVFWEGTHNS